MSFSTNLPHIIKCDLNYLNHNFKHVDAAIFKCMICEIEIEIVYNSFNEYNIWSPRYGFPYTDNKLDINCKEHMIKKLLE
jgi:hypothetical protein